MQSVALRPREARRKSPPALRTLVLNADYRPLSTYPLSIIAAQDAVSAIWRERIAGIAPSYGPKTVSAVPNEAAIVRRIWLPELDAGCDPQGLAVDGGGIYVSAYRNDSLGTPSRSVPGGPHRSRERAVRPDMLTCRARAAMPAASPSGATACFTSPTPTRCSRPRSPVRLIEMRASGSLRSVPGLLEGSLRRRRMGYGSAVTKIVPAGSSASRRRP